MDNNHIFFLPTCVVQMGLFCVCTVFLFLAETQHMYTYALKLNNLDSLSDIHFHKWSVYIMK